MSYRINYTGFCIQGLVRQNNEDNLWCRDHCLPMVHTDVDRKLDGYVLPGKNADFAVFDGMGGEEKGEAASYLAAQKYGVLAGKQISEEADCSTPTAEEKLCRQMNRTILEYARINQVQSMGTTVVSLRFAKNGIRGFNLGDSRCYRLTGNHLEMLSVDHAEWFENAGKGALTQCLGVPEAEFIPQLAVFSTEYQKGDLYLLCSDGITEMIPDEQLEEILREPGTIREKADRMRDTVLIHGAADNATVLLFEITEVSGKPGKALRKRNQSNGKMTEQDYCAAEGGRRRLVVNLISAFAVLGVIIGIIITVFAKNGTGLSEFGMGLVLICGIIAIIFQIIIWISGREGPDK